MTGTPPSVDRGLADVIGVEANGAGTDTISVTVRSPDTGCDGYADFWEVVRPDGTLVYRRVLTHSHVGEQPFTRSGGPVAAGADDELIIRAHFSTGGYGGAAMSGTVTTGFADTTLDRGFAADLETSDPQPDDCAF